MVLKANIEHIDSILLPWQGLIDRDFAGYRNHVIRMACYCLLLRDCNLEEQQKIEIAACFHDIGLWTHKTLDYLAPSVPPAQDFLEEQGLGDWNEEIAQMITDHHRLRSVRSGISPLVEVFRQGDLIDFSRGMVRFGLSRATIRTVQQAYPNAGFHKSLGQKAAAWFVKNPLNPAPMMRW